MQQINLYRIFKRKSNPTPKLSDPILSKPIRKTKASMQKIKGLKEKQVEDLIKTLKDRFEKNMNRHKGLAWADVQKRLAANSEKLWALNEMEKTGGEPDVVRYDKKAGGICVL